MVQLLLMLKPLDNFVLVEFFDKSTVGMHYGLILLTFVKYHNYHRLMSLISLTTSVYVCYSFEESCMIRKHGHFIWGSIPMSYPVSYWCHMHCVIRITFSNKKIKKINKFNFLEIACVVPILVSISVLPRLYHLNAILTILFYYYGSIWKHSSALLSTG